MTSGPEPHLHTVAVGLGAFIIAVCLFGTVTALIAGFVANVASIQLTPLGTTMWEFPIIGVSAGAILIFMGASWVVVEEVFIGGSDDE